MSHLTHDPYVVELGDGNSGILHIVVVVLLCGTIFEIEYYLLSSRRNDATARDARLYSFQPYLDKIKFKIIIKL